jgi:hypothetical protein
MVIMSEERTIQRASSVSLPGERHSGDIWKVRRWTLSHFKSILPTQSVYEEMYNEELEVFAYAEEPATKGARQWYIRRCVNAVFLSAWTQSVNDRKVVDSKARQYAAMVLRLLEEELRDWIFEETGIKVTVHELRRYFDGAVHSLGRR